MSRPTGTALPSPPDGAPPGDIVGRVAALVEVLIAFSVVHLTYRSFKHFTVLGRAESSSRLNFSAGSAMILFTIIVLLLTRRDFERYGLTLKGWRGSLNIGLGLAVLFVPLAAAVIKLAGIPFDPLHPPDLTSAVIAAAGDLAGTILVLWLLMHKRRFMGSPHPALGLVALVGLLSIPLLLALRFDRSLTDVLLTVLWLFFGAGFGEEVFFRGYIQSRIDQSFGRPRRLLGIAFGAGLIISSLLFGFIHALNTVDYFSNRFEFAWLWMLPNFTAGLFFGVLRQRTGSILAGSVTHGLLDVLAQIPALLP
jgi:uncharacterized protein